MTRKGWILLLALGVIWGVPYLLDPRGQVAVLGLIVLAIAPLHSRGIHLRL